MTEDSSISIVLTPVQLAAVLQGESISGESTLSNRLWGGLALAGWPRCLGGAAVCGAGAYRLNSLSGGYDGSEPGSISRA